MTDRQKELSKLIAYVRGMGKNPTVPTADIVTAQIKIKKTLIQIFGDSSAESQNCRQFALFHPIPSLNSARVRREFSAQDEFSDVLRYLENLMRELKDDENKETQSVPKEPEEESEGSDSILELKAISKNLKSEGGKFSNFKNDFRAIEKAIETLEESFSGSWVGYHSRVFYENFSAIPSGAHFSPEWGLLLGPRLATATGGLSGSIGNWREYSPREISEKLTALAKVQNPAATVGSDALKCYQKSKAEIISILAVQKLIAWDSHLQTLEDEVQRLIPLDFKAIAQSRSPSGTFPCRDTRAIAEGNTIPPHVEAYAKLQLVRNSYQLCENLAELTNQICQHLSRLGAVKNMPQQPGRTEVDPRLVFVVHGRDDKVRDIVELFLHRIGLQPIVLFREVSGGKVIIEKFEHYAGKVGYALVLLTPEDIGFLKADYNGGVNGEEEERARQNVVFEMGFFFSQLGRGRVAALQKGKVTKPSDIDGIVYISMKDGDAEWKLALAKELLAAGLSVEMSKI